MGRGPSDVRPSHIRATSPAVRLRRRRSGCTIPLRRRPVRIRPAGGWGRVESAQEMYHREFDMSSHKWHTSSRRFQNTPKPSWNCLNRIARDLSPDALYVGSQEMNESSLRWGRSPVSFAGFRHNVEAMRSCSGISQHRRVQRTYRLRFEKKYIPSPSIWMRTATAASTRLPLSLPLRVGQMSTMSSGEPQMPCIV